jgi:diguanylate cyclase (GGDEF)-like protein
MELAEIEDRLPGYPAQAQADIRWLTRELRKAFNLGSHHPEPPTSAIYDSLTGLPSVGAFGVRFAMARARASRNKKIFAVMSVDLSLTRGAAAGQLSERDAEEVLKQIASRLTACVRETDTVARVDEDKFSLILEDLVSPENAERVEQKVRAALAEPLKSETRSFLVDSSISLQFYPTSQPPDSSVH